MPQTCQAVRTRTIGDLPWGVRNPMYPINYDLLAVEAYNQKLFDFDVRDKRDRWRLHRERLTMLAGRQQRQWDLSHDEFKYMICLPNATLQRFEHLSLTLERNLFQTEWSSSPDGSERAHRDGFANALNVGRKFCYVDAKTTLEKEKRWRDFFISLNEDDDDELPDDYDEEGSEASTDTEDDEQEGNPSQEAEEGETGSSGDQEHAVEHEREKEEEDTIDEAGDESGGRSEDELNWDESSDEEDYEDDYEKEEGQDTIG